MRKILYGFCIAFGLLSISSCGESTLGGLASGDSESGSVLSGSYANMLVLGDFMYVLGDGSLKTLSLENPALPVEIDVKELNFTIESIFINQGNIFVGSQNGMFIYTINANGIPEFRSITPYESIGEIQPCDPVVANQTHAYATLSTTIETNSSCFRFTQLNELRIFDISDLENPVLMNTEQMLQPKGLGLDDDLLFVCESEGGLKIFDVSNPLDIELLYHFENFEAYDLIPANGLLLVIGGDELHQYDYSDIGNVVKLSSFDLLD